jgi:hypothetical protein
MAIPTPDHPFKDLTSPALRAASGVRERPAAPARRSRHSTA